MIQLLQWMRGVPPVTPLNDTPLLPMVSKSKLARFLRNELASGRLKIYAKKRGRSN